MMCVQKFRKKSVIKSLQCSFAEPDFVITEPVCIGRCAPKGTHPIESITGQYYRCKPGQKVTKEIKMLCHPKSTLMKIKVKVVESCKCVLTKKTKGNKKRRKKKNRRRKGKNRENKTDKNKNKGDRKRRRRKNRRRHNKHKKSSKLTNNDR